jgi:hypothetical protein
MNDCKQGNHIREVINLNDKRYEERFKSLEATAREAKVSSEERFKSVNEFRATLSDQTRTFVPRKEVEISLHQLEKRIDALMKTVQTRTGQDAGSKLGWAHAVAVISLILSVTAILKIFG